MIYKWLKRIDNLKGYEIFISFKMRLLDIEGIIVV